MPAIEINGRMSDFYVADDIGVIMSVGGGIAGVKGG